MSELLQRILAEKRVVVCCGAGGVGKTTTAAALGLEAAKAGKRVLVLTIDPARRLANALGLEEFGNEARQVPIEAPGELFAMMLDMKQTFDEMVADYAGSAEEIRRISENRLYRSMSHALAGIQEYMAVAKLHDVLAKERYDLVVLDTPPTSNALDFLDAPARFLNFLDQDALRWLLKATSDAGQLSFRLLDVGASFVLRLLGRIAGVEVLKDIGEFIAAFYPLFLGFRDRAQKIERLLLSPELGFVIVAAPTSVQVDEALFFQSKLRHQGLGALGVIVNRLHQPLPEASFGKDVEAFLSGALPPDAAAALLAVGAEHRALCATEAAALVRLESAIGAGTNIVRVLELAEDVHSIAGLTALGAAAFRNRSE